MIDLVGAALSALERIVLAFGVLSVVVVGAAAIWGTLTSVRDAIALARSPEVRPGDVEAGRTTVRGRAVSDDALDAPLSGEPCAVYSLRESWSPYAGLWETEGEVVAAVPFSVVGPTGRVLVRPAADERERLGTLDAPNLDLADERTETYHARSDRPAALVRALDRHEGLGSEEDAPLRYRERSVPLGEEVLVTGRARRRGGELVIEKEDGPFLLSDTSTRDSVVTKLLVATILAVVAAITLGLARFGTKLLI